MAEEQVPLTLGILGAGQIVSNVHLPVALALPELRLSWMADVNLEKAEAVARAFGVKHVPLPANLADLPPCDVLLLAIPFGERDLYYQALRQHNCALYVEKPFSRSVQHHQTICSWFPANRLGCGLQSRSWGPTLLIKELIADRMFGSLREIQFGFGSLGAIVVGGRYSSDARLAGGGLLMEMGVHGLDTVLFVTDATAIEVRSKTMIMDHGIDVHTAAELVVTMPGHGRVDCRIVVSCLEDTIDSIRFVFEHCVAVLGNAGLTIEGLRSRRPYLMSAQPRVYPLTPFETFGEHWSRFISGIRSGAPNWTSASTALLTTEVIEQLYTPVFAADHVSTS
jgi:predicted dehydrogenase